VTEVESFFNFFKSRKSPQKDDEDSDKVLEEEEEKMLEDIETDMDIVIAITEELIPKALYYYLGVLEEEMYNLDESDENGEDSSDNDSKPKQKKKKKKSSEDANEPKAEVKKECKQQ